MSLFTTLLLLYSTVGFDVVFLETNRIKGIMFFSTYTLDVLYTVIRSHMVNMMYYIRVYTMIHLVSDTMHAVILSEQYCHYVPFFVSPPHNIADLEARNRRYFPCEYTSQGVVSYDFI